MSKSTKSNIQLIIGPMYSGKTSTLQNELERYERAKEGVMYFTHSSDTIKITHNNSPKEEPITRKEPIRITSIKELLKYNFDSISVIGIDEFQFFGLNETFEEICDILHSIMKGKNIKIILSGLDSDYQQKPFIIMCLMISQAYSIIKKSAICQMCKNINKEAIFSHRLNDSKEQIQIGDNYIAICEECRVLLQEKKN